jgi:hypothetical protein
LIGVLDGRMATLLVQLSSRQPDPKNIQKSEPRAKGKLTGVKSPESSRRISVRGNATDID